MWIPLAIFCPSNCFPSHIDGFHVALKGHFHGDTRNTILDMWCESERFELNGPLVENHFMPTNPTKATHNYVFQISTRRSKKKSNIELGIIICEWYSLSWYVKWKNQLHLSPLCCIIDRYNTFDYESYEKVPFRIRTNGIVHMCQPNDIAL